MRRVPLAPVAAAFVLAVPWPATAQSLLPLGHYMQPPCEPCYSAEWICDSGPPLDPRLYPSPDPQPMGSGCHWGPCEWTGGGGSIDCFEEPAGTELGVCSVQRWPTPMIFPQCDPRTCDPAEDQIPTTPGTEWLGLEHPRFPWIDPDCLAAIPSPQDFGGFCADVGAERLPEVFVEFFGSQANAVCALTTGALTFCENGRYCHGPHCVQCTEDGDCYTQRPRPSALDDDGDLHEAAMNSVCGERRNLCDAAIHEEGGATRTTFTNQTTGETYTVTRTTVEPPPLSDAERAERNRERVERAIETAGQRAERQAQQRAADGQAGPDPLTPSAPRSTVRAPRASNPTSECLRSGSQTCLRRLTRPGGMPVPPARVRESHPFAVGKRPKEIGDPVAIGSGQLVDSIVDLEVPAGGGPGALHFRLERMYSSAGTSQGVLGRNWAHSYEERLRPVNELYPGVEDLPHHCVAELPVVRCVAHEVGPSATELFVQDRASGVFLPMPGVRAALAQQRELDGSMTWVLRGHDGTTTLFDDDGRLRTKRDRHGRSLHFWYGADDAGPLQAVVDPLERVIRFGYEGGRLASVTDFTGRRVRYVYAAVPRPQLPPSLQHALALTEPHVPGLHETQALLVEAHLDAPGTDDAAPGTSKWRYSYVTQDQIDPYFPEPAPFYADPTRELCGEVLRGVDERLARQATIDHLVGNLTQVIDPRGRVVLHTEYQLDPASEDFDRVIAQRYGDGAGDPLGPTAHFLYTTTPPAGALPSSTGAVAVAQATETCDAIWRAHAGRPVFPSSLAIYAGNPPPPLTPSDWVATGLWPAVLGADLVALSSDVTDACQFVKVTDRRGHDTWYALNFLGQAIGEARVLPPEEGGGFAYTRRQFNAHGDLVAEMTPSGRLVRLGYDELSPSPASRGNVLSLTESGGGLSRTTTWSYEPLYNQPIHERDPLGRESWWFYDFQELDPTQGERIVVEYLARFGSTATSVSQLSPELSFHGVDVNGDGRSDRLSGDEVFVWRPYATLADGSWQTDYEWLVHDELGGLVAVHEANGRSTTYAYHPANRPSGVAVEMTSIFLDEAFSGQRAARLYTGGYLRAEEIPISQSSGADLGLASFETSRREWAYDVGGRVIAESGDGGAIARFGYDGFGRVVRAIDPEGFEIALAYDARHQVEAIAEGFQPGPVTVDAGDARRTFYAWGNEDNLLAECTELDVGACPRGDAIAMALARMQSPAAIVTTYDYDAEAALLVATDPEGHATHVHRNSRGLPIHVLWSGVEPAMYGWDADGLLSWASNGAYETTSFQRDGFGRVVDETRPDGSRARYEWDAGDRMLERRVLDLYGGELSVERFDHDERDRVWRERRAWLVPAGQLPQPGWTPEVVTIWIPDPDGRPARRIDPDGAVTTWEYDTIGRPVREIDAVGNQIVRHHDGAARRIVERERGEGRELTRSIDLDRRGLRVHAIEQGGGGVERTESWAWDGLGAIVEEIDAVGNRTRYAYDLAGRMTGFARPIVEAGDPEVGAKLEHDRRGLITRLEDPSSVVTTRTYSPNGRLASETSGLQSVSLSYDGAGRPTWISRGSGDSHQLHYSGGRPWISIAYREGTMTAARVWSWDGAGRIVAATSYAAAPGGAWDLVDTTRVHDGLGRLLEENTTVAGSTWRTRRAYDEAGALATLQYPDGSSVEATTDPLGRTVGLAFGDEAHGLSWRGEALASVDSAVEGYPMLSSETVFDGLDRAVSRDVSTYSGPAPVSPPVYAETRTPDGRGRVSYSTRAWRVPGGTVVRAHAFAYSGLGHLSEVTGDDGSRVYDRDPSGTLLREHDPGALLTRYEATTWAPHGHELASVAWPGALAAIEVDADGRVANDGRSALEWDPYDQLVAATRLDGAGTWRYLYDAFGRRVMKVDPAGATEGYAYDGWNVIATYAGGVSRTRVVYGPLDDQPLSVRDDEDPPWFPVLDVQGNVVALVEDGSITERYEYDPYGAVTIHDGAGVLRCQETSANPCQPLTSFGYNAQRRDPETGLYYYKHRYYSPALRTFLSRDPLGFEDAFDPWLYVAGDPANSTDPLGLSSMGGGGANAGAGAPKREPKPKGLTLKRPRNAVRVAVTVARIIFGREKFDGVGVDQGKGGAVDLLKPQGEGQQRRGFDAVKRGRPNRAPKPTGDPPPRDRPPLPDELRGGTVSGAKPTPAPPKPAPPPRSSGGSWYSTTNSGVRVRGGGWSRAFRAIGKIGRGVGAVLWIVSVKSDLEGDPHDTLIYRSLQESKGLDRCPDGSPMCNP